MCSPFAFFRVYTDHKKMGMRNHKKCLFLKIDPRKGL